MDIRPNLLFVDDDGRILAGLRRQLRSRVAQWDVTFVDSARAALAHAGQRAVDVVITDMRMPGMDGAELLALVARDHPRMARLVLSGNVADGGIALARSGAHRFLTKPCSLETLVSEIQSALRVRDLLDGTADDHLGRAWSLPPVLAAGCREVLEGVGGDDGTFDARRVLAADSSRIRSLVARAYPPLGGRPAEPGRLGRCDLFGLAMGLRLFATLLERGDDCWERAEDRALQAVGQAQAGAGVLLDALLCGLLAELAASDPAVVRYLLPSWGLPLNTVELLAGGPLQFVPAACR